MRLARLLLASIGALILLTLAAASPATATTTDPTTTAVAFTLDPAALVQLALAVVLPILVGLVSTRITAPGRKAWLLAALTLATALLTELARALAAGTVFDLGVALVTALPAFAISVATHYGLWKPTGTAEALKDLGRTSSSTH